MERKWMQISQTVSMGADIQSIMSETHYVCSGVFHGGAFLCMDKHFIKKTKKIYNYHESGKLK